jgi:hypothetical protein
MMTALLSQTLNHGQCLRSSITATTTKTAAAISEGFQ